MDLDAFRRCRKPQDGIAAPIPAGDVALVEPNLLIQGPARGLGDGALDLVADAVGVDGLPTIDRSHDAADPDAPGLVLDVEFESDRAISAKVLVTRECEAPAGAVTSAGWQLGWGGPAEPVGRCLDYGAGALVLHVAQAKRHRVCACRRRQLVPEALDGKDVEVCAEGSHGRHP